MIEPLRGFVMVYLSTPVEICERRDGKVFTRKRALEFSRTLLVFPTSMRNLRMRTLSSIPQRSRQKKRRRRSCYTWNVKDLLESTMICEPTFERLQS